LSAWHRGRPCTKIDSRCGQSRWSQPKHRGAYRRPVCRRRHLLRWDDFCRVDYRNNIVEQDQRAIKRITRAMLGLKTFRCARILNAGIEVMHMIRKGQLCDNNYLASSAANQFYSLAF
jgi:transposase-like protein